MIVFQIVISNNSHYLNYFIRLLNHFKINKIFQKLVNKYVLLKFLVKISYLRTFKLY